MSYIIVVSYWAQLLRFHEKLVSNTQVLYNVRGLNSVSDIRKPHLGVCQDIVQLGVSFFLIVANRCQVFEAEEILEIQ